jgi:hypothetical protein
MFYGGESMILLENAIAQRANFQAATSGRRSCCHRRARCYYSATKKCSMRLFISITALLLALPTHAMTQCPAGTRSGFMWRCVAIPVQETIVKIANYTSVESACSATFPDKAADYASRLQYLLSTRDLWPGEILRQRPEYAAELAKARQHMQVFDAVQLERECGQFLSVIN